MALSCLARPAAVTVLGLSATFAGGAMAKTYTLSISGDSGARYQGACTVTVLSGDQRIELEGAVPLRRVFDGDGLSCRLRADGRVVVEITHDGSRARSATSGGTVQVSAR
jgi:hypothetical protein